MSKTSLAWAGWELTWPLLTLRDKQTTESQEGKDFWKQREAQSWSGYYSNRAGGCRRGRQVSWEGRAGFGGIFSQLQLPRAWVSQ
jgi:hypothetical protein